MLSHGWDVKPYEDSRMLHIVDVFSSGTELMVEALSKKFIDTKSDVSDKVVNMDFHKRMYDIKLIYREGIKFIAPNVAMGSTHKLCVFDSISPLFSTNTQGVFRLIHVLKFATRAGKATGIGIMHTGVHDSKTEEEFKSLAEAVIDVKSHGETSSFITIPKYPGKHEEGPFPLEVTEKGVKILPITMPDLF